MKLKTLFKTLALSHVRRALSAAKSRTMNLIFHDSKKVQNKTFFGSFRFHYNWCSSKRHSHVLPVPAPVFDGLPSYAAPLSSSYYYDSTWHAAIPTAAADDLPGQNGNYSHNHNQHHHESQLYGYLQWLEEKRVQDKPSGGDAEGNDIDKLADKFIASCHAKFILEKQESARRFKEMLERSA